MVNLSPYAQRARRFLLSDTALRISAFLVGIIICLSDYVDGLFDHQDTQSIFFLSLAYAPLVAVALNTYIGVGVWFLVWFIVGMNPTGESMNQVSLVLPATLSSGLIVYFLPWRQALWYSMMTLLMLSFTPFLIPPFDSAVHLVATIGVLLALISGLLINWFKQATLQTRSELLLSQAHQEQVRQEERIKLAHELHDIVAHEITLIAMQAQRARYLKTPEQTEMILESIGKSAQQTLQDLRSVVSLLKNHSAAVEEPLLYSEDLLEIGDLSGETTEAESLTNDLHRIAKALRELGFSVDLDISGDVKRIPRTIRQALRRTAREMATNVFKHGDPRVPVRIYLRINTQGFSLKTINGISHEKSTIGSTQTGLEAMKTRCTSLGGTLEIAEDNKLWIIEAIYPLHR